MAAEEVDLLRGGIHHLDQRVGDVLLGVSRHTLGAAHVLDDDGPVGVDLVFLGLHWILVHVNVVNLDLARPVLVGVEARTEPIEVRRLIEHHEPRGRSQAAQQLVRLLRQAVLLVLRQIPSLVAAIRQVVDRDEDAQHDDDARRGNRSVARIPALEERDDLAPLSECVDQDERKSGVGTIRRVLIPLGLREANDQRAEDEDDTDPTEDAEDPLHHGHPLHRSTSTDRAVRNSPNAMKLR